MGGTKYVPIRESGRIIDRETGSESSKYKGVEENWSFDGNTIAAGAVRFTWLAGWLKSGEIRECRLHRKVWENLLNLLRTEQSPAV